jgi:hypothetical protein
VTRGLVQASAAGVLAARSIMNGGRPAHAAPPAATP